MISKSALPSRQLDVRYRIPAGEARSEWMVKGSTFLGTVGHAQDVDAAHSFIQRVRDTYPDANHHAWAFRISEGPQAVIGSSDDGEPGGTAGRPMLAVLEGSGLREIVVVGTRYFGGIKLGSGGLVRAYTHVAREAVKALPIAERVLHQLVRITVDYAVYAKLEYLLPQHGVKVEGQEYSDVVVLSLAVPYERYEQVSDLLRELTNGQVVLEEHRLGHRYDLATAA